MRLIVVSMITAPPWGQLAWPSYPNHNAISVTSGDVGIGTTGPSYQLDVQGAGPAMQRLLTDNAGLGYLDLFNNNTLWYSGLDVRLVTENSTGTGIAIVDLVKYADGEFSINNGDVSGSISFGTGPATRMTISANGNVGIGTTNLPAARLPALGSVGFAEHSVLLFGYIGALGRSQIEHHRGAGSRLCAAEIVYDEASYVFS